MVVQRWWFGDDDVGSVRASDLHGYDPRLLRSLVSEMNEGTVYAESVDRQIPVFAGYESRGQFFCHVCYS